MNAKKTLEEFISDTKKHLESEEYDSALKILLGAIKVYPNEPSLIINIGNIHKHRGRPRQAENYYKKALEIKESKEAYNNLSVVYLDANALKLSISHSAKAIEIDANYIDAHYNAALALERTGEYNDAIDHLNFILKIDKNNKKALVVLFRIYQNICNWKDMISIQNKLDDMVGNGEEHPFVGVSRSEDLAANFKIASSYANKNYTKFETTSKFGMVGGGAEVSSPEEEKIKIGYICGEFRNHPTYHLIKNLFKSHNSQKFNIFLFSFRHDEKIKEKLKEDVYKFFDITEITDTSAAEIIKEYKLDVLIDLTVIISRNRINILKAKPAKNIISYLGFPGTSGHNFYDYILTDKIVAPEEHQPFYTEKFLYLPNCYQINDGLSNFSKTKTTRNEHLLPKNAFVLACFNQSFKLDKTTFDCWIEILRELPDSILWLLDDNKVAQQNLSNYIKKKNIDEKRLIFAEKLSREKHIERLKLADVALDTRIYNGHTTTIDALQAGIPVVTKTGSHFASRVSTSLLLSLGLDELCCEDLISYKEKVIELCINEKVRARLLDKLTAKNNFEKIHNNELFAKNLEQTLMGIL